MQAARARWHTEPTLVSGATVQGAGLQDGIAVGCGHST
jgi:hypothetical protein